MHAAPLTSLVCPIDGSRLTHTGVTQRCAQGHSFDIAREGYCNLLVVQHKASLDPGDSKDMVAARRRVLEADHYAPIATHLFERYLEPMARAQQQPLRIVDAGCGEGNYLNRIVQLADQSSQAGVLHLAGIDVSKWAVKAAAKHKVPVTWLVANNSKPPFAHGAVDVFLCLFGFPVWEGFKSVQTVGQFVVLVDPGPDHLIELREIIYPVVQKSEPPSWPKAEAAGYRLVESSTLRFSTTLPTPAMIADIVAMTPHAHRMSAEGRAALETHQHLTVTLEVVVRVMQIAPTNA